MSEPEKEKAEAEATANADANADADAHESPSSGAAPPTPPNLAPSPSEPDARTPTPTDEGETGDLVFDTLWSRVLAAWDDDKPHGALVEYSIKNQKLPELAGKYKALTSDPEKGARAKKRLDGVVMAATHLLMSMKTPPPPKSNKMLNLMVGLVAVALIGYLAYKIVMVRGGGAP